MNRLKVALILGNKPDFNEYALKYFILSLNKNQNTYEFYFPYIKKFELADGKEDPQNWINSLSKDLWHIPKKNHHIDNLLNEPFYSVDFLNLEDNKISSASISTASTKEIEIFIDKDINFTNGKVYKNIFDLRRIKNNFLIHTMYKLVKNYYFIRYEDIQTHPKEILLEISDRYNIPLKHDNNLNCDILYYKNLKNEIFIPRKLDLSNEIVQKIIDNIDKNQEFDILKYDLYNIWKLSS